MGALDDISLLPYTTGPYLAMMVRRIAQAGDTAKIPATEIYNDLNILIVSDRPKFEEDISHRLVSRVGLDAALNSGRRVTVDIVRPSTLMAFKEHLTQKSP